MVQKVIIAGAGLTGATCARTLAESGIPCTVLEKSMTPGGNCKTQRDPTTGVMVHQNGPHIFNTNSQKAWGWVNRFATMRAFTYRVKAFTPKGLFTLPVNLLTLNQFFGKALRPDEAREFLQKQGKPGSTPENFEEAAIQTLGEDLYQNFFQGYTRKQWGCEPAELPADIFFRLPIRFNYDDNYFQTQFQGIPEEGYSSLIERMLDHPLIELECGQEIDPKNPGDGSTLVFTGPLDALFQFQFGRLSYRSVGFQQVSTDAADFQGGVVINDTRPEIAWTRTCEHKHFAPWETHEGTYVTREFSRETQIGEAPHYPKRLAADMEKLQGYERLAKLASHPDSLQESGLALPTITAGRLGTYRYINMDQAILSGMETAEKIKAA